MKTCVEYVQQDDEKVSPDFIEAVVAETLEHCGYAFLEPKEVSVSVAFVSPERIRDLNKAYRQKEKVTDVLSFPEYADRSEMERDGRPEIFLGELILCYDYIDEAAREDGVSLEQEMAFILSHGVLHLLGFDHSEDMFALQDRISERYASNRAN